MLNNSSPGQAVYEPFCGSGSTLIAAETTDRICYAVELDPAYVDVAVQRWQDFTGQDASHHETGESFAARSETSGGGGSKVRAGNQTTDGPADRTRGHNSNRGSIR